MLERENCLNCSFFVSGTCVFSDDGQPLPEEWFIESVDLKCENYETISH